MTKPKKVSAGVATGSKLYPDYKIHPLPKNTPAAGPAPVSVTLRLPPDLLRAVKTWAQLRAPHGASVSAMLARCVAILAEQERGDRRALGPVIDQDDRASICTRVPAEHAALLADFVARRNGSDGTMTINDALEHVVRAVVS